MKYPNIGMNVLFTKQNKFVAVCMRLIKNLAMLIAIFILDLGIHSPNIFTTIKFLHVINFLFILMLNILSKRKNSEYLSVILLILFKKWSTNHQICISNTFEFVKWFFPFLRIIHMKIFLELAKVRKYHNNDRAEKILSGYFICLFEKNAFLD